MIQLVEGEKQLISAIQSLEQYPHELETGEKLTPTQENLFNRGKLIFKEQMEDWTNVFESLFAKGLIQHDGPNYVLTSLGRTYVAHIRRERISKRYSNLLTRSEKSKAFSSFCAQVFGKDLCQFNAMDMPQLEKLLEVLNLTVESQVLDLGCGIGKITEYIADVTHAHLIGIDIATEAIKQAQDRTREKKDYLEFREGDMNNLSLPPAAIDTIIVIDSLHFVDNLEETIGQLKALLMPHGQMGIFYSESSLSNNAAEILSAENTQLAHTLKKFDLPFRTWEFTESEHEIRRRQLDVAAELKEEFETESNLDLYRDLIEESADNLKLLNAGKKRRYLYHIQLS